MNNKSPVCSKCGIEVRQDGFCSKCHKYVQSISFREWKKRKKVQYKKKVGKRISWKKLLWVLGLISSAPILYIIAVDEISFLETLIAPLEYVIISGLIWLLIERIRDPEKWEKERKEYWQKELDKERAKQEARALEQALHPVICPTCGSTHVHKIGAFSRAFSVQLLGLHSNVINKTFECENCGYTW